MSKTLSEYRGIVRGLVSDTQYDETLIDQAINWFVYEVFNNTRTRLMEASDELFASQGDTLLEMPDDFMTRIHFYMSAPQVLNMKFGFTEYETFMDSYSNFASANQQQGQTWTDYGADIRFSAPLNADHTFQLDYLREPVPMEEDDDECEVPDRYSELVAKGALARVMEINEDYAEAAQERTNMEPLMTTFIRNEGRGGGKVGPGVIRTNRGRGSYRVDRDFPGGG